MASTRASISKVSKRPKINIIPPKQLFVDLTQDDTKTPSPKLQISSPSAPNAPSKTPSTKDTSSSSIDYIPKSPTSSTSLSPNGYLNPPTSPPPRVSPPPPTQENASMDITLTLSPITPLDVQFDTPSPSPPIIGHPIPWNLLEAHEEGHMARQCTKPKRPRNSTWFKEKAMLAEALESRVVLDEKQMTFFGNGDTVITGQASPEIPTLEAFQTDNLNAFDSDYDEAPSVLKIHLCDDIYGITIVYNSTLQWTEQQTSL
ncbi:hypothetical protein Tco_0841430 [Tanacetum coccineum]|uniref:Uncharacterized protein n=1 Tax=Tanacetum coccineum TaxID=301880 RepID=A0ABQ5AXP5_9ASTR